MPLNLTEEQIIQLAPDAASVKAGKGLAVPGKWVLLACSERAVWGHCQGSGKNPYQTAIDLNDIAFKCSCPSRKFPCKHGLGLLLLFAAKPELFEQAEEPDWVKSRGRQPHTRNGNGCFAISARPMRDKGLPSSRPN